MAVTRHDKFQPALAQYYLITFHKTRELKTFAGCKNEYFCTRRFCVVDFNNGSSNASGRWVPKCSSILIDSLYSSITLSYFECPNTHQLSGLASKTLPYKRVVFVVGSSLQTYLLVGFLPATPILLSVFIRTDILKFIVDQNLSFLDLYVYTFSIFTHLKFAKITHKIYGYYFFPR